MTRQQKKIDKANRSNKRQQKWLDKMRASIEEGVPLHKAFEALEQEVQREINTEPCRATEVRESHRTFLRLWDTYLKAS